MGAPQVIGQRSGESRDPSANWRWTPIPDPPGWTPPSSRMVATFVGLAAATTLIRAGATPIGILTVGALIFAMAAAGARRLPVIPPVLLSVALLPAVGVGSGLALVALVGAWSFLLWSSQLDAPGPRHAGPPLSLGPLGLMNAAPILGWLLPWVPVGGVGFLILCWLERRHPRRAHGASLRLTAIGALAGRAVGAIAMLPVALLTFVFWGAQRLTGYNPLGDTPRGWLRREGSDQEPTRQFSTTAVPRRRWRRAHRFAGTALVMVVLVTVVGYRLTRPAPTPTSRAFAQQENFDQLWAEMWTFSRGVRFDNTALLRADDFSGTHLNQVDGIRRTWRAPDCSCQRLRVWWFGGSAAWGYFQSDLDSLPSQVARAAWREGVVLDIENLAFPGLTLAQEGQQFSWRAASEPLPDLVVFYDGANELDFQVARNVDGNGRDESPVSYVEEPFDLLLRTVGRLQAFVPRRDAGTIDRSGGGDPLLDADELAGHAMARYRRSVEIAEGTARARGVPAIFVWQPTQTTAPPSVFSPFEGETWSDVDLEWWRRYSSTARAELPDQVVDLSDALDGQTEALMPDWAHTNEVGAAIVGRDLLDHLLPTLRDLTDEEQEARGP